MKTALIFGRAVGVWDEVAKAKELPDYDHILAVGSAGVDAPFDFDCWVSFHAILFPHWVEKRARKWGPSTYRKRFFSNTYKGSPVRNRMPAPSDFPVEYVYCNGGSSGLVATMAALKLLDVDRVVLAGIPMDVERNGYDQTDTPWKEAIPHRVAWERDVAELTGRVRSMSGWTQQLLGGQPPTSEWLTEPMEAAA